MQCADFLKKITSDLRVYVDTATGMYVISMEYAKKCCGTESCPRLLSGEPNYNGCFEFNR